MSKLKSIIVDIDGTLSNPNHRQKYIDKPEPTQEDWLMFFNTSDKDTPNEWCTEIVKNFSNVGYEIIYLTGRPEKIRGITDIWIRKNVPNVPFHLFMRQDKDRRHDTDIKTQIYKEDIEPIFKVLFTIDDRRSVVEMWRELGLTCLHCADWSDEHERKAQLILENDRG